MADDIDWGVHRGSCRVFYAERRCTCGATVASDPGEHACSRWCAQHTALGGPLDTAEPTGEVRFVQERIGRAELDRLRALLSRDDRDSLTPWEVVEIAADEFAPLLAKLRAVEELADEFDANINWREWGIGNRIRRALDAES